MNESKATRYQRLRRRAQLSSAVAALGFLLVVATTPAIHTLVAWAESWATHWPDWLQPFGVTAVVVSLLSLGAEVVALPAATWTSPRGVGGGSVWTTQMRDAGVGALFALALAGVVRTALWFSADWWWVVASVALTVASVVALKVVGAGLAAVGETRPLSKPDLALRLQELSRQACGRSVAVREWSPATGGASAMVTGLGTTAQVLVSTDMVRDWADDEIAVVVAHELSHQARHDLARRVAMDAVLLTVTLWAGDVAVGWLGPGLGVSGASDVAALPLLGVSAAVIWTAVRPLRLAQSRAHERLADRGALALTGDAGAFARALRRLEEAHLAEERPSRLTRWFFHRHPTVEERLAQSRTGVPSGGRR